MTSLQMIDLDVGGYQRINTLYVGNDVKVIQARMNDGRTVAIKTVPGSTSPGAYNEISTIRQLDHPNIIKFYGMFYDRLNQFSGIFQYAGITLLEFAKRHRNKIDERIIKNIIKQISSALNYCHNLSIAHRDLKLENICIDLANMKVTLIDFNLCVSFGERRHRYLSGFVGTKYYLAPEIYEGDEYDVLSADIWSLGIITYALMYKTFPFDDDSNLPDYTLYFLTDSKWQFSFLCKNMVRRMLNPNPLRRPSARTILMSLWLNVPFWSKG